MRKFWILALAAFAAACVHNLPNADMANSMTDAAQARAYVDMNGTFYPPDWRTSIGADEVRRAHSLYAAINNAEGLLAHVHDAEDRYLEDLRRLAEGRRRVFVLVLGFNTNHPNSAVELRAMQDAIGPRPDDLVIEFYWDGHHAPHHVGTPRIWFWGVPSSKVAGQRGLRRILNQLGDSEIIIVTFSRGAAVALSALSNPAYSESFQCATADLPFLPPRFDLLGTPPLNDGGDIRLVMVAPAVGEADFWAPSAPPDCIGPDARDGSFRTFPERLRSIRYAYNGRDYATTKLGLSRFFNSTSLGAELDAGRDVACHYGIVQPYRVEGRFGHGFAQYLADPSFRRMLNASGVGLRGEADPTATPIEHQYDCG
jgi:hypothetical protein